MRSRYVVCYDIADAKRLRAVHKKMRGYGDPVQYSVFRCDLSPAERTLLVEALTELIHHREDRVMLIDIGPTDGRGRECIETLGVKTDENPVERICVVV